MPAAAHAYPVIADRYDVKETIGSGGFAKVKAGRHKATGMPVAIKIMDKVGLGDDLPRAYLEIRTLKELRHPNICQLYEVVETKEKLFLILEFAPGGELFDYIVAKDRLKEPEARAFFRKILCALAYVHSKGYAHRDLKPENLLLDAQQNIKLIDFGLVAHPSALDQPLSTCCGSPAYAAPELISGRAYIGTEADVWSLGILLYALLCGFLPFDDDSTAVLYRLIQRGKYDKPRWLSQGSLEILSAMLQTNPKHRLTIDQLAQHPWTNKGFDNPIDWRSTFSDTPDPVVVAEISQAYQRSRDEVAEEISQWKYDHLTATYLLLLKMKEAGKRLQLRVPKPPQSPVGTPKLERALPPTFARLRLPSADYSMYFSTESLPGSDNEASMSIPSSPVLRPKSHPASASVPGTPIHSHVDRFKIVHAEVAAPVPRSLSIDESMNRTGLNGDTLLAQAEKLPDKAATIGGYMNRRMRAQSVDAELDSIGLSPNSSPKKKPSKTTDTLPARQGQVAASGSGLRGSLENIRLKLNFLSGSKEPRKVKGLYNVKTTSTKSADHVLAELERAVKGRGIPYKTKGFVIRCKTIDDRGKVLLSFDLEVCQLPRLEMIGVRRKRLKGDTFAFKKLVEELIEEARL